MYTDMCIYVYIHTHVCVYHLCDIYIYISATFLNKVKSRAVKVLFLEEDSS